MYLTTNVLFRTVYYHVNKIMKMCHCRFKIRQAAKRELPLSSRGRGVTSGLEHQGSRGCLKAQHCLLTWYVNENKNCMFK